MKQYFFICTMLLAAACSWEKVIVTEEILDQEVVENQPKVTYIVAKGGETKASIANDGAFTWNAKDKIAVYAGGYKISEELDGPYDNTNGAVFEFTGREAFDEEDRANFAVFPSSLVYDGNGNLYATDVTASSLKVNLPGTYTLAQVAYGVTGVTPVPMIATNEPNGNLAFKNICALLRITVNNISKDAHTLKITFPGKKVQGVFTLKSVVPGTTATVTEDTAGEDDTITITDLGISSFTSGLVLSLPVPTGEYGDVVVGAYDSDGHRIHYIYKPIKSSANWAPTRTTARKVTVNLPVFTVSNDKKVVFAPGNLQAVIGASFSNDIPNYATSWNFASHQYEAIGATKTTKSGSYSINSFRASNTIGDVCDLFAWYGDAATGFGKGSSYTDDKYKYGIIRPSGNIGIYTGGTYNTDTNKWSGGDHLLSDWGHNTIGDYPVDTWRVLNESEWNSAVLTREGATYLRATISDASPVAYGLIITPDQYTHPSGVNAFANPNSATGASSDNTYTLSDWEKLEAAGCVFLPITNTRKKKNSVLDTGYPADGWYWTSAKGSSGKKATALVFYDLALGVTNINNDSSSGTSTQPSDNNITNVVVDRYNGCAVRLVRDVN